MAVRDKHLLEERFVWRLSGGGLGSDAAEAGFVDPEEGRERREVADVGDVIDVLQDGWRQRRLL
jgi:hypothetical protein